MVASAKQMRPLRTFANLAHRPSGEIVPGIFKKISHSGGLVARSDGFRIVQAEHRWSVLCERCKSHFSALLAILQIGRTAKVASTSATDSDPLITNPRRTCRLTHCYVFFLFNCLILQIVLCMTFVNAFLACLSL